ncbi:class I SAM-dependent methyltransferase [Actinocorallia sp. A-T 12471]|uniref:class I SAM-dependent methyltransferase n=1 Tax=Actinocorallia sp. A-T 12471 TaxID=3089813 RepID=UPI0029CD7E96|nr:class I SAM-dependent methyltransferase [Actinocorallia sp. A-T 12471]MDX6745005.1 class I SAM-dependent methyltransferase [Actinocorallia sp. A-T 12471]
MCAERVRRPEGELTRGTTNPNRLRRQDLWTAATTPLPPGALVVDLGYGASPVTAVELYTRLRAARPDVRVVGLEIAQDRVDAARSFLAEHADAYPGLSFARGGFELPVDRPPDLVRAANVLRQYDEESAWRTWDRLVERLAPGGTLVEGTCDEIGRRHVWVALHRASATGGAAPATITFAASVAHLPRPSALAERLPKTLIHRNVPGEAVHAFLRDMDLAWASAAPQSVFGPRQRWLATVEQIRRTWPVLTRPPYGGVRRWRLGEITLPWDALAPQR